MSKTLEEQLRGRFKKENLPDAPDPKKIAAKTRPAVREAVEKTPPPDNEDPDEFNDMMLDRFSRYYETDTVGEGPLRRLKDQIGEAQLFAIGEDLPSSKKIDLHDIDRNDDLIGILRRHIERFRSNKKPEDRVIAFIPGGWPGKPLWNAVESDLRALCSQNYIFPAKYRSRSNPGIFYVQVRLPNPTGKTYPR